MNENSNISNVSEKVGFHSAVEPREITWSDLCDFNDTQPWNDNRNDKIVGNFEISYSDESFASDASEKDVATISVTSSISLPQASGCESNIGITKSPSNNSRRVSSPVLSDFSPQPTRSSSRLTRRSTSGLRKNSGVTSSSNDIKTLTKESKSLSNNSIKSKNSFTSSLSVSSSSSIRSSSTKKTSSSISSTKGITNVPRQSAHSPIKSTYKKQISAGEELATNTALDVTISL